MSKKMSSFTSAEITAEFLGDSFWRIARYFAELQEHTPEQLPVVAKLVGIGRRKAYYYARIYRVFSSLGVDEDRLDLIGWTKLTVLANHITKSNCEQLLSLAESCTARELTILMQDGVPVDGTRVVLLYLEPVDYELFEKAVLAFGGKKVGRGLVDKEEALTKALASIKS
jgi:hypothetical protein